MGAQSKVSSQTTSRQSHQIPVGAGLVPALDPSPTDGLHPTAVSGALIKLSLGWVFVGAGAMMALLSLAAGLRREIAEMKMA